ncbi:unnamed protein product [Sphagnum tenellum]
MSSNKVSPDAPTSTFVKNARRQQVDTVTDKTINFAKIFEGKTAQDIEGKRVITIAYRMYPDRPGRNVEYAASIFRKDNETETYNRRNHIQTARGRLSVRPLYTNFHFSDEMRDILLETNVPKSKEERKSWSSTDKGQHWRETRRRIDETMSKFLRKEVGKNGVGAKHRTHLSEIERTRSGNLVTYDNHHNATMATVNNHKKKGKAPTNNLSNSLSSTTFDLDSVVLGAHRSR